MAKISGFMSGFVEFLGIPDRYFLRMTTGNVTRQPSLEDILHGRLDLSQFRGLRWSSVRLNGTNPSQQNPIRRAVKDNETVV
ncbi:hypothetical protein [Antarctobacter sp.]|uniref:hypothetical protein n=1 Tax=Antarctobacter sp. TaxID=1872577 RepID=UPI002B27400D|nr:hypothetical protein [Antarctobacter sp.]